MELGRKLNSFLSIIYENGIREYNIQEYDIFSIMDAMYSLAEGTSYCDDAGNYYYVVKYDDMNEVLQNYFGIVAPREQVEDILYQDGKYYFPVWDYGELGVPVVVANSVEQIEGKYKVSFDIAYIWPENFDTGEVNAVEDWDIYYDYDIDQINNDKFCEYIGYGNAVLEVKDDNISIVEFHSYEGYPVALTEDEAYQKVEEYWVSLGRNLPENIEKEGLTEYGYCFWGYNMTEGHANTHFRIAVDINTGKLYDFNAYCQ